MITVVGDTVVVMRGIAEIFETSTLIELFVISSLGKEVLVPEDVETVYESATVVTSFFEVVVMVPKLIIAVVVFVITAVEGDSAVDFPVGESFKVLEESIGIRKGLLTFEPVAVVVWEAIAGTPVVIADNEDIEVLEVVGNALATNVVIFADNTERVISTEDIPEVLRLDVLAVKTDSTFMVEFILSWGIVAIAEASVAIGVAVVAFNGTVSALITAVDDTIIPTEVAVVICETSRVTDVSVISGLGKDDLLTEKWELLMSRILKLLFLLQHLQWCLNFLQQFLMGWLQLLKVIW